MKKIEITKIGKMILELIIVLALFIITFYFVSGYHRKEFNSKYRESKISNNGFDYENEENKLTTYPIVGIILFSFYYLVWYIRVYIQSLYAITEDKLSYRITLFTGLVPFIISVLFLLIIWILP